MGWRVEGSGGAVRPAGQQWRPMGGGDARPARSGIPTVYDHCHALTKEGQPCSAPNMGGQKWCAGHARSKGLI